MRLIGVIAAASVIMGLSCAEFKLPSEQAMSDVFTPKKNIRLVETPPPENIPILATGELDSWRALCDQCHVGPNYSSFSILNWGHRQNCIEGMTCHDCHAKELHRTDVRGDKGKCIECHMVRGISIDCKTCHDEGWRKQHDPHPGPPGQTHVMSSDWKEIICLKCHGSERWCNNCHGLPMPHPENILEVHSSLVAGKPDVCANCHGTQVCIRCHRESGVKIQGGG